MPVPYRLAPRARTDIEEIADYLVQRNPRAASDLLAEFQRQWEFLAAYPYIGAQRADIGPSVRHKIIRSYVALYSMEGDSVLILRVMHGKRDISDKDLPE